MNDDYILTHLDPDNAIPDDEYAPQLAAGLDGPEVAADEQPGIPEVALEDAGPSHEILEAILGMARNNLRRTIWQEVLDERARQLKKWGDQRRPLGASATWKQVADIHRANCDEAEAAGECTWRHITLEETFEAFAETERDPFRREVVQTMAVLLSALEDTYRDEFEQ